MTQEEKQLLKDTEFNDECYDFTFKLIQNNKKQLGLDDNYIGVPKVIYDLCMICCQYGYNKAKEEIKQVYDQAMQDFDERYKIAYVVTRSDLHYDDIEKVFFYKNKAEEYCKSFNKDKNSDHRNITEIEITL